MSSQWIEIDAEVLAEIKVQAEAFVDSPNDVLRRVFGLPAGDRPTCAPVPSTRRRRLAPASAPTTPRRPQARTGELLDQGEYDLPLLRALAARGGSATRSQVVTAVEELLEDRLTPLDRQRLQSGEVRWTNRLGFARLRAIDRGYIRGDSPRGLWQITDAGSAHLGELKAEAANSEPTQMEPSQ